MNINIYHYHYHQSDDIKEIKKQLNTIMANISQLTEKVAALQVALDSEQEQIAAAIGALKLAVADLQVLVAEGGSPAERQALADQLDAIIVDLQATIPDESTTTSTTETTTEVPVV